MTDLVTMRLNLDPVLKERLKISGVERGMTLNELLPKMLEQCLDGQMPPPTTNGGLSDQEDLGVTEACDEIEDEIPLQPPVQDVVRQLLSQHQEGIKKAFVHLAERQERLEALGKEQPAQLEKTFAQIRKVTEEAVAQSTREWLGFARGQRLRRVWIVGGFAAMAVANFALLQLAAGTWLGREIAVWQTGADTEWQAAQRLASNGSYLHANLAAETKTLLDNPDFLERYSKCVERAKAARFAVNCRLVLPALSRRP